MHIQKEIIRKHVVKFTNLTGITTLIFPIMNC
jgi:hypothetical protein